MKLMINIPDEAYELLKSKSELDNIAESIIANGTPVSTDDDLISRDALKKAFYNQECWNIVIESIIANAPTVEYPFYQEAYQKIDEARKVIWDTSLPDACKVMTLRKLIDYECGAKMKGGKEE